MSEWLLLWLVAVFLYLVDCCSWVKAAAWCCFRGVRGWRASSGSRLFGNDQGGVAFCHPLAQNGSVLHCAEWPVSISPEGVICSPASHGDSESRPRLWSFREITSVSSSFDDLLINGVRIGAGSAMAALGIAEHLNELRELPESKRASCIRAAIKENLDVKEIRKTWDDFLKQTARLKRTAQATLILLFGLAPLAIALLGPYPAWMYLLGALLSLGVLSARQLFVVHRNHFKPAGFDRWVQAISVASFPLAATRAVDRVSKDLFYGRHPIAVICAIEPGPASGPALREQWFDLSIPAVEPYREWYRSALATEVGRLLERAGFDFSRPPEIDDPAVEQFCPRCHSQFTKAAERCPDCPDVALVAIGNVPLRAGGQR
jgi:hypothetical protein